MSRYFPRVRPVKGETMKTMVGAAKYVYALSSIAAARGISKEQAKHARDKKRFDAGDLRSIAEYICQTGRLNAELSKAVLDLERVRSERDIYRTILEREISRKQLRKFVNEIEGAGIMMETDDGETEIITDPQAPVSCPVVIIDRKG